MSSREWHMSRAPRFPAAKTGASSLAVQEVQRLLSSNSRVFEDAEFTRPRHPFLCLALALVQL